MRKFKRWGTTRQTLTVAGALLVLLIVVGALAGGGKDTTATTRTPADATATTAATTTDAAATTDAPAAKPAAVRPKPAAKPKPSGDPAIDRNSRAYANAVQGCRLSAAIVRSAAVKGDTDLVDMADMTTTARDTCDNIRGNLLGMDTDHFDDQAQTAWTGVDRIKSGLNALMAYIDDPRPTKIIEARDKLNEGDATAREGLRGINRRRHVYGLRALTVG
jgi:hypothetical protein